MVTEGWEPTIEKTSPGLAESEPWAVVVNCLEPIVHVVGVALKVMLTTSPEANLSLPVTALARMIPVAES